MKFAPYSFSKLNTHDGCNRRFKYQYIDKLPQGEFDKTALLKGGAIHSILEHFPNKSSHKLASRYQSITDDFIKSELGKKYLNVSSTREFRFGLTEDLVGCGYSDKDAIFRGSVDYVSLIDGVLNVCDWKSGKLKDQKWQNFNQLMFYAVYFFQEYKKIDTIRISYIYIEHDSENEIVLKREFLEKYIEQLTSSITNAENDVKFIKNQTKLCNWCPFKVHCDDDIL